MDNKYHAFPRARQRVSERASKQISAAEVASEGKCMEQTNERAVRMNERANRLLMTGIGSPKPTWARGRLALTQRQSAFKFTNHTTAHDLRPLPHKPINHHCICKSSAPASVSKARMRKSSRLQASAPGAGKRSCSKRSCRVLECMEEGTNVTSMRFLSVRPRGRWEQIWK